MTAQIIPTGDEPLYTQTTSLEGTPFRLRFCFATRLASWLLDLYTLDGEQVAMGLKLVCNWDLLNKCASPLRPPGQLLVISNTSDLSNPGLEDLVPSGRCVLVYLPIANVLAVRALRSGS